MKTFLLMLLVGIILTGCSMSQRYPPKPSKIYIQIPTKMPKYYFENDDFDEYTQCYQKSHFIDLMKERGITEIEVFEAKLDTHSGYFYCSEIGEIGASKSGECGRGCKFYVPRNGKSGRCTSSKTAYISDNLITLKLKT